MPRYLSTWTPEVNQVSHQTETPSLSGRVHILGMGNIGNFVAHALASKNSPPPITLLMHNDGIYRTFCRKKKSISVNHNGLEDVKTGFDVQVLSDDVWLSESRRHRDDSTAIDAPNAADELLERTEEGQIECLIVTCKAFMTVRAIWKVRHRLTTASTIVLLQNGMGVVKKLNEIVFPDANDRPNYVQGVISHGLSMQDKFQIAHRGVGTITLAPVVTDQSPPLLAEEDTHWAPSTKYILRLLTLTPSLVATTETPVGLLQYQLEKLAVNCLINPLTALYDCTNGELLYIFKVTRTMRLLLFEISSVIFALPELQGVPGIEDRFAPERLLRLTMNVANTTAENTSSMLQDLQLGKFTEIDHMNGWIVDRGEELGIKCTLNYMICQMVRSKLTIRQRRDNTSIPLDQDDIQVAEDFASQTTVKQDQ
ncbi:uncharacterized protein N7483_007739 [Penicillium malachiteum]|uniref:uncharacterized protein n=1 Tax=Penicillium malachiteum TaxID=1324776 RepID=UPI002546F9AD|nr:uncharacterized protein N7483_007739 [Penicillium malachiteum]KAJ5726382.1 hypothetical protein N7483_007739 [Penicillium malachiteum]